MKEEKELIKKVDNVNHPKHYEGRCSIECIDTVELIFGAEKVKDFCLLNAYKYIWRYKNKNGMEDLEKAKWYIDKCKSLIAINSLQVNTKEYDIIDKLNMLIVKGMKEYEK